MSEVITPNSNLHQSSNIPTPISNTNSNPKSNLDSSLGSREICKKCNQLIIEGHAYELGEDRWHIDCFNCSKCNTSLGCNSNFLVLGNGNLICSNCSYNCKQCNRKIDDLAILTGDQAYCSNCFKCRSCKNKIEDLRYARTSKGLFCMDCHEKLMAKKKKYDAKKKHLAMLQQKQAQLEKEKEEREQQLQQQQQQQRQYEDQNKRHLQSANSSRNSLIQSYMTNNNNSASNSSFYDQNQNDSTNSLTSHKNKNLPAPPPRSHNPISPNKLNENRNILNSQETLLSKHSSIQRDSPESFYTNSVNENSLSKPNSASILHIDNDFSIEEVQNSSDSDSNENTIKAETSLRNKNSRSKVSNGFYTPRVDNPIKTPGSDEMNDDRTINFNSPNGKETLEPPIDVTPKEQIQQNQTHRKDTDPKSNKNYFILSPNNFHDNEFHNANIRSPMVDSPGTLLSRSSSHNNDNLKPQTLTVEETSRSNCSSPFAKANRQARVVETNDDIITDELSDDIIQNLSTPQQKSKSRENASISLSSPPPKLPLPNTPTKRQNSSNTPKKFKFDESIPHGLGLEGVNYEDHIIKQQQIDDNRKIFDDQPPMKSPMRNIGNVTPAVTKLEDEQKIQQSPAQQQEHQQQQSSLSRTASVLRSLTHKRSVSGGSQSKFSIFKSPREELNAARGHSRHISDGSISNGASNQNNGVSTNNNGSGYYHALQQQQQQQHQQHLQQQQQQSKYSPSHGRSTSDSTMMFFDSSNDPYDLKAIKQEISKLINEKNLYEQDVKKLKNDKLKLSDQLKNIQSKITTESIKYDNLVSEIKDLESKKESLVSENNQLLEQNKQFEASRLNRSSSTEIDSFNNDITTVTNASSFSTSSPMKDPDYHYQNHQQSHQTQQQQNQYQQNSQQQQQQQQPQEDEQTHKATRLKFWRRPKIGMPQVVTTTSSNNENNFANSNQNSRIPNSFSSQGLRVPSNGSNGNHNQNNNNNNNNNNNKFTKSISSNFLDSFLNGNNNSNYDQSQQQHQHQQHHQDQPRHNDGSQLFQSTLTERAEYEKNLIPIIITRCIKEVESRGINQEGIYRISGGNSLIVSIENEFSSLYKQKGEIDEKRMSKLEEILSNGDIHAITSALKRYLRKLPDPVIPYIKYEEFISISQQQHLSKEEKIKLLKTAISNLPLTNQKVLKELCNHLHKINSQNNENRMNFKNLSVVFAPTLIRDKTGEKELTDMGFRNDSIELLFNESNLIFS
ncbi:RGA2 [Candida pseudojiufengensis]|uniref:RGA2 n=1 Tax=Candida pseudojiufengensis TaxID=497109 RepID=UPI0022245078|nr:RGA2 [Candida pseudojiufengensis]KAI5962125.1 RGA2 [Candida pseudojiufengensis]